MWPSCETLVAMPTGSSLHFTRNGPRHHISASTARPPVQPTRVRIRLYIQFIIKWQRSIVNSQGDPGCLLLWKTLLCSGQVQSEAGDQRYCHYPNRGNSFGYFKLAGSLQSWLSLFSRSSCVLFLVHTFTRSLHATQRLKVHTHNLSLKLMSYSISIAN